MRLTRIEMEALPFLIDRYTLLTTVERFNKFMGLNHHEFTREVLRNGRLLVKFIDNHQYNSTRNIK